MEYVLEDALRYGSYIKFTYEKIIIVICRGKGDNKWYDEYHIVENSTIDRFGNALRLSYNAFIESDVESISFKIRHYDDLKDIFCRSEFTLSKNRGLDKVFLKYDTLLVELHEDDILKIHKAITELPDSDSTPNQLQIKSENT